MVLNCKPEHVSPLPPLLLSLLNWGFLVGPLCSWRLLILTFLTILYLGSSDYLGSSLHCLLPEYHNSLLTCPTTSSLINLQCNFHNVARIIFLKYKSDCVILLLRIHWSKIEYPYLSHDRQAYLSNLVSCHPATSHISQCSRQAHLFAISPMTNAHLCLHAFSQAS